MAIFELRVLCGTNEKELRMSIRFAKHFSLLAGAFCLLAGCGDQGSVSNSTPQANQPLGKRVESVVQPLVDAGWAQGIVIGITQQGQDKYFSFGSMSADAPAAPNEPNEPNEKTVFEIGSITKVFTAIVLAELATKEQVAMQAPISKFLPENIVAPAPGGKPITLESLAAHTSGLPVIPANFWQEGDIIHDSNVAGLRWGEYSEDQVRDYFQQPSPPLNEKRTYLYSNLGMGLLGHLLERATGEPVNDLIVHRVCKPLGMESTSCVLEPTAVGHNADGVHVDNWPQGESVLAGAFALRSTCKDLVTFAKANLAPDASPLAGALKLAQQQRAEINEAEQAALGWKRNIHGVIYATGATGGFRCAMFLHPSTKTAVVTMANTQFGGVTGGRGGQFDALAGSLLNVTLGAPPLPLDLPTPLPKSPTALDDFAGSYRPEDGSPGPSFPIRVEDGKLLTMGPGKLEARLWPQAKDTFFLRSYVSELRFRRDDSGVVVGADLKFDGNESRLKRFEE